MNLPCKKWALGGLLSICCSSSSFATSEVIRSFDLGDRLYHAGSVAVAAYPHWGSVVIGPIPAVLGALNSSATVAGHLNPASKIVAIVSQDRLAHALMISESRYGDVASDPATTLPNQKAMLKVASTAQLFAEKCLAGWNVGLNQMTIVDGEQAEIRHAFSDKKIDFGFVWTSFTYLAANDAAHAKALPCLNIDSFDMPSFIVTRSDLLNEPDPVRLAANRKIVARLVAQHLGAWAKAKMNPQDAAKRLRAEYTREDIKVTDAQALAELEARRPPDLDGQRLAFTAPAGAPAPLAATLDGIIDFMVASGTIKAADKPAGSELMDGSILELIAGDPELGAVARGEKPPGQ
jgi:ABC-type nitrate/sulfonate/bicarbonate transport system substrate-binding protein